MEAMMGVEPPTTAAGKNPQIALVYAVGPIMSGESESSAFGGESTVGSDTLIKALRDAEKIRPRQGDRAARRQPWRIGPGQRPDLARSRHLRQAGRRQHGRRGGQRRLLHLDGGRQDLCRARHAHRLDRRGRRQDGLARTVGQGRHQRPDDQPRQERQLVFGHRSVFGVRERKPGTG